MNKEQLLKEFVKFYCDNSENTAKSYVRSVNEYLTFTMGYTNWKYRILSKVKFSMCFYFI